MFINTKKQRKKFGNISKFAAAKKHRRGRNKMSGKGNISNQSTENAFAILEYIIGQPEPLKLTDIAKSLDMNASTVSRYITALHACGYVEQDAKTGRYKATTKICELANRFMSHFDVARLAHPFVQEISDYYGETCCFSVERDNQVFYIDIVVSSSRTLMNVQRIGNSAPLHSTAAGKLFLTNYSPAQLEALMERGPLVRFTDTTIVTADALLREIDRIRADGYSTDDGENEPWIKCIAYPIFNANGKVVASISITGPSFRLSKEITLEKQRHLADTARAMSVKLQRLGNFNI